ncbi:glycosyltransferase family 2 protein [Segetibacter koreensis]|uniref:glycosyltransferase family 2 protein n=1 Tax=Segetibacter koreensis TaxID=398037 RepID=UPI00036E0255|nr:glycosyltransferase family 2 protein [Segetibacter koreensis]
MISLSIIIVNYKTPLLIVDCIRSIKSQTKNISYEIIVADNLSNDDSKEIICTEFTDVIWLQINYNAGFARANNAGIRLSKGEIILLLNPDTIVVDDAIENCYLRFIKSNYVACGVQLLNQDNTPQISGNFFMKGGLNHLLALPYLGPFLRTIAFAIKVKKTNVQQASAEEKVDWINGAYLMVKKSAINKAGLLDEDFFLYAEETEWCSRLLKTGEICIYGDLHVTHIQGETINKETKTSDKGYSNLYDKKGLQLMVSNHLRIRKQFGAGWFLFHLFIFTIEIPIFTILSFFDNFFHGKYPFADSKKIKGFTKNVFKVWQLLPVIMMKKPHFYKMF